MCLAATLCMMAEVSTSGCSISKRAVGEIRKRRQTVSVDGLSDTCVPTDGSDIRKQHRIDRYSMCKSN